MTTKQHMKPAPKRAVKVDMKAKMKRMRHLLATQGVAALNAARKHGPQAIP